MKANINTQIGGEGDTLEQAVADLAANAERLGLTIPDECRVHVETAHQRTGGGGLFLLATWYASATIERSIEVVV